MEKTTETSNKMDKVLEGLGKEPKSIWVQDVFTINEKGDVKLFGFTIRKGKKRWGNCF